MSFKIIGTGSCIPSLIKTNDDLATIVDTSDEWIRPKTGIESRPVLSTESLSDLAAAAAQAALKDSGLSAGEIDLIICATLQGDYICPSLACVVQSRIGASCPAFDINAACSGFLYALDTAAGFIARGRAKNVLIICAESMSRHIDWQDRNTCVLFGDGAGAVVLTSGEELLSIKLTASGNTEELVIPSGRRSPFEDKTVEAPYLKMKGQSVFLFAVSSMKNDIEDVVKAAGKKLDDITYVLPHQANLRIINTAVSMLGIDRAKVLTNIQKRGNISAASIVILLDETSKAGLLKNGDIIVLSAFGGGLTSGACVIRWDKPEKIQIGN